MRSRNAARDNSDMSTTQRIVTLLDSATEIVCALGFSNELVARSHECQFAREIEGLAPLTEPKFKVEGSSAEIDNRVKQIVGDALSVYRVDAARLRELRPDVIVTQSQCEVCAVSESDVEAAVAEWLGVKPRIVSLAPYSLADVFDDITRVADALGAGRRCLRGGCPWSGSREPLARSNEEHRNPGHVGRIPTDLCLHRVDRSSDGRGKLDAGTGGDGGRDQPLRQGRRAFAVDDLQRAG